MNKTLKNVLIVLAIAFLAYAIYAVYTMFKAGETAISSLLKAPFTLAASTWSAISSLFTSSSVPTIDSNAAAAALGVNSTTGTALDTNWAINPANVSTIWASDLSK